MIQFNKKRFVIILLFSLVLFITLVSISPVYSQNAEIPGLPGELPVEQLEELSQKTPEQMANDSWQYLRKEWAEIVKVKAPFLWEIHSFLLSKQTFFKIVFNKDYSFTWVFFWILVLWIYFASLAGKIFDGLGIIKQNFGIIVGILVAIILAHINLINWVVNGALHLVYSQSAWWMRAILWLVFIVIITLLFYLRDTFSELITASKEKKEKEEIKEKVEILEAESKGREEGREASKSLREAKKKYQQTEFDFK